MVVNDPIGDTLTRIRNAYMRSYPTVTVLYSKMIVSILNILKEYNYVENYEVVDDKFKSISVELKYVDGKPAAKNLRRVSKPGLRKYVGYKSIPRVLNGFGISILSTPQGIITGRKAQEQKVGGEFLCTVY